MHSLDSINNYRPNQLSENIRNEKEMDPVVREGEKQLTKAQKELISRRNEQVLIALGITTQDSTRTPEAGTSKNKGKTIDPCEWGNLNPDEDEVNVEAKKAALESYKLTLAQKKKELKERALQLQTSPEPTRDANSVPLNHAPELNRHIQRKENFHMLWKVVPWTKLLQIVTWAKPCRNWLIVARVLGYHNAGCEPG